MAEFGQLLLALVRIALVPLLGYAILRLGRNWPQATLAVILAVHATGAEALPNRAPRQTAASPAKLSRQRFRAADPEPCVSRQEMTSMTLEQQLAKLAKLGLKLDDGITVDGREVHAEVPPRVEYRLTPFGERFVPLLEQIERFQNELASDVGSERAAGPT
jgi:hypothetical protein